MDRHYSQRGNLFKLAGYKVMRGDISIDEYMFKLGTFFVNGPADAWTIGSTKTIVWTHNSSSAENVRIELSLDAGQGLWAA